MNVIVFAESKGGCSVKNELSQLPSEFNRVAINVIMLTKEVRVPVTKKIVVSKWVWVMV